jgi:Cu(I)/Ag(I) efflux system membrane fusion protein
MRGTALVLLALALGCGGTRSEPATVRGGGIELRAALEPPAGLVGANHLWLELRDAQGRPLEGADVAVRVHMHAMGTMPAMGGPASVRAIGGGRYRADFELPMGSTWLVEIDARPRGGEPLRAEGSLTVGTPGLRLESAAGARGAPAAEAGGDAGHEGHSAEFSIDPRRLQTIGVRTGIAERAQIAASVRAVGRVAWDETALADVSTRVRGWVGELAAGSVGMRVERGAVLLTLYSPELYTAQQEYLGALASARARSGGEDELARAARNRLRLWNVAPEDLQRIARSGAPLEYVPLRSPATGYVIEKGVVAGGAVEPGQRLFRIAPLDRVWLEADVYASELAAVREGIPAHVTLPHAPERRHEGRVAYVYPYLTGETRTTRVRVELPNPELELRPDMYVEVELSGDGAERTVVPESAVLYAGRRRFVFRDLGDGRFRPQEVETGLHTGGRVEIVRGLEPGERIVVSGTFLIAAESRLRAALEQW